MKGNEGASVFATQHARRLHNNGTLARDAWVYHRAFISRRQREIPCLQPRGVGQVSVRPHASAFVYGDYLLLTFGLSKLSAISRSIESFFNIKYMSERINKNMYLHIMDKKNQQSIFKNSVIKNSVINL